ncbi:c-type cytochrome biogenesis protein CcsB [Mariprofundus ferrooxydans]|uniref:Cytochrome c assembly protein n=1 Tax=Mariprofundus ferrooxydans PV-1 TaxID=314345 RepID=Q0F117_9PROT|nr:c-type cytochrome biogenesis protein CcsB [Mariprofundus ferrooxydans]EAU55374.1 Cytochrome c assembly protein [Mariprofundus ferrooxydans PV-1]KON47708.1 cytochrome C assembly protein [Mariprofundus ferrooxydans]
MTATTAESGFFVALNRGRGAFLRFAAYLGAMVGIAAMAKFGAGAYEENAFLYQILSMKGLMWGGTGALAGCGLAVVASTLKPSLLDAKSARNFVPWLDGFVLMVVLAAIWALFEPAQSQISYDNQSNLFAGRVIMAMNVVFIFSAVSYIAYLFAPDSFIGRVATWSAYAGVYLGGSALLLRWHESYLFDLDIGHAPVSNLYEVFILLFCITAAIYLALEKRYQAKAMGAFVMTLVSAGVFFGVWLDSVGQADIKPLVPALQSYWMKIHVPMNFVGYGSFAVACGAGMAYLFRYRLESKGGTSKMLAIFPSLDQLDQLAYKAVAIGFPAFTLATILGAAWAAEAWGGYWSWDPKETWALIVWLIYGSYLHARVSHGWHGKALAWWAVAGFLVTVFCFLGVNMYLSGLHSYGHLS